ncbi:MAG: Smr/MutS family protein [Bacteroidia bacterium]|nr:Smr/MutS family protein [Bacteroidia bacterium]
MKYKKGDKVNFTDFLGGGTVLEALGNDMYRIEADEGIEMTVHKNEIVAQFNPYKSMPVFRKNSGESSPAAKESAPEQQNTEPDWEQSGKIKIRKEKTGKKSLQEDDSAAESSEKWISKGLEDEKRKLDKEPDAWENPGKKVIPKVRDKEYTDKTLHVKADDLKKPNKKVMPAVKEVIPEIDLHFDEIEVNTWRLAPEERLQYQLRFFQQKLEEFIAARVRKFVVIHGVGEGVLRAEVRSILRSYPQIYYYDASWQKYGRGATMAEIRY